MLIHVVRYGLVSVCFHQVLKLSIDQDNQNCSRVVSECDTMCNSLLCLGFNTELFKQPLAVLSNTNRVHFFPCPQSEASTIFPLYLHKLPVVTSEILTVIVVFQFQGLVGIFTSHQLFDAGEIELFVG